MGCVPSKQGITLTFYDRRGDPDPAKPPVFGTLAHLYSLPRKDHPGDPSNEYGSADWLTDVILAENEADLNAMHATQTAQHATSASSKSVQVQWKARDIAGKQSAGRQEDQLTIATGVPSTVPTGLSLLVVDKIDVLPADTVMDASNSLWKKWCDQKVFIAKLAEQASGKPPKPAPDDTPAQPSL